MPQDWNYGTDRLGGASMGLGSRWRGFERYGLISTVSKAAHSSLLPALRGSVGSLEGNCHSNLRALHRA